MNLELLDGSMETLTPAYGRDYRSRTAVTKDFVDGKNFVLHRVGETRTTYCSVRDFRPGVGVWIQYNRLTNKTRVTVPR
jgi:hypothetical protein